MSEQRSSNQVVVGGPAIYIPHGAPMHSPSRDCPYCEVSRLTAERDEAQKRAVFQTDALDALYPKLREVEEELRAFKKHVPIDTLQLIARCNAAEAARDRLQRLVDAAFPRPTDETTAEHT